MTTATIDAVVIGAGANGLVAAAALGRAGLKVTLLERGPASGGQGQVVEFTPGFRAAPLGLDPGWLPGGIARALGLDGLEPLAADTPLSVLIQPGEWLTLSRTTTRAADAIRVHSVGDAARWPDFVGRLRNLAGFLEALYQLPAPDIDTAALGELIPLLGLGQRFRGLGRVDMIEFLRMLPLSVWEVADDWFETSALKAAIATAGIQDHRQGPRSGGTGFVMLHHLVGAPSGSVRGRVPWRAGPAAFTEAAERAARRFGVTVRHNAAVSGIAIRDDAVAAVELENGERMETRAVVSTADPSKTLLDWIDPVWLDPDFTHAVRNIRYRGCTAVVMYALEALPELRGLPKEALGGVVSLTSQVVDLEKAADAAKYGTMSDAPHVEVSVPTLHWPDLAPGGKHVMVARAQYAPHRLRNGDGWTGGRRDALADAVTAGIAAVSPGFTSRVSKRVAWTPRDLEERYGLREGATSQGELGLDQILFMRPLAGWGRHRTPIRGLYLGGAGTHPGPGVLGGAGWLAAQRLLGERGRGEGGG